MSTTPEMAAAKQRVRKAIENAGVLGDLADLYLDAAQLDAMLEAVVLAAIGDLVPRQLFAVKPALLCNRYGAHVYGFGLERCDCGEKLAPGTPHNPPPIEPT